MKLKLKFIIFFLALTACKPKEKSDELFSKAVETFINPVLDQETRIDSSLKLTNKALKLNDENIDALSHKASLLFIKKDMEGLLEVSDQMIALEPDKPLYLIQKAIYQELGGNNKEAKTNYNKAIQLYKKYLKSDSTDFNLNIEYIGALESSGDTINANRILERLKTYKYADWQMELIEDYKNQPITKERIFLFWNGEIEYGEIAE